MGEQSLDDMVKRIHHPAVFFLPLDLFEKATGEDWKDFDTLGITNNLIVRTEHGKISPLEHANEVMVLLGRLDRLKVNIFEILKMSSALDNEAFLYFLNNYTHHLNNWSIVTELTKTDAEHKARNYIPEIQSYLDLQHENTLNHKEELDSRFGKWLKKANLHKINKWPIPSIEEVNKEHKRIAVPKSLLATPTAKLKPKSPAKKTSKVNQLDTKTVDYDLLTNVFNVDATLLNNG